MLKKANERFKSYNSRENPPSISELLLLISLINEYAMDDPDGRTVRLPNLKQVMTNFFEFGPTSGILAAIEANNPQNLEVIDLKLLSDIINYRRKNYFDCEELSQRVGELIGLDFEDNKENMAQMTDVYNSLCNFDFENEELTVDAFIRITTQEYTNLNTIRIIQTIREFDDDEDGHIQFDEFKNLIQCLSRTQDQVREECMLELEELL